MPGPIRRLINNLRSEGLLDFTSPTRTIRQEHPDEQPTGGL